MKKAAMRISLKGDQRFGLVGPDQVSVWGVFPDRRTGGRNGMRWRLVRHLCHEDGSVIDGRGVEERRGYLFKDCLSVRGKYALSEWGKGQYLTAEQGLALLGEVEALQKLYWGAATAEPPEGAFMAPSKEDVVTPEIYFSRVGSGRWDFSDISERCLGRYLMALSQGMKPRLSFVDPEYGFDGEQLAPHQVYGFPNALVGGAVTEVTESSVTIESPDGQREYFLAPGLSPTVQPHILAVAGQRLWALADKRMDVMKTSFLQASERAGFVPAYVLKAVPPDEREFVRVALRVDHLPTWQVVEVPYEGHFADLGSGYGATRVDLMGSDLADRNIRERREYARLQRERSALSSSQQEAVK